MTPLQNSALERWEEALAVVGDESAPSTDPHRTPLRAFGRRMAKYLGINDSDAFSLRQIRNYYLLERGFKLEQIAGVPLLHLMDRIRASGGLEARPLTWREVTQGTSNEQLLREFDETKHLSTEALRSALNARSIELGAGRPMTYNVRQALTFTNVEIDDIKDIVKKLGVRVRRENEGAWIGKIRPTRLFAMQIHQALILAYGQKGK